MRDINIWTKLIFSIFIDLIGMVSYLLPGIGEVWDVIWGAISGFLIWLLYGNIFVAGFGFLEEIFPGTDIIPTATLMWCYEYFRGGK